MYRRIAATCSIAFLAAFGLAACDRSDPQSAQMPEPGSASSAAATMADHASEANSMEQEAERERQAQLARAAADPVVGIIERAELCLHFGGEEGFDEARRAQIDRAFEDNRCDTVVADGDALKARRPQDAARIDQALAPLRD